MRGMVRAVEVEELLLFFPRVLYIYIYIYMCVCVCFLLFWRLFLVVLGVGVAFIQMISNHL